MKAAIPKFARPTALALTVVTLTLAIATLAFDWVVKVRNADELAERLRKAEDAAPDDPAAAGPLQAEVERQTASSLVREPRQQVAGITALAAAGICIVLLNVKKSANSPVPGSVKCRSDCLIRPATDELAIRPT